MADPAEQRPLTRSVSLAPSDGPIFNVSAVPASRPALPPTNSLRADTVAELKCE
jgi:hypothetical protein